MNIDEEVAFVVEVGGHTLVHPDNDERIHFRKSTKTGYIVIRHMKGNQVYGQDHVRGSHAKKRLTQLVRTSKWSLRANEGVESHDKNIHDFFGNDKGNNMRLHEDDGAGEDGTDELVANYMNNTPGQDQIGVTSHDVDVPRLELPAAHQERIERYINAGKNDVIIAKMCRVDLADVKHIRSKN